VKRLEITWADRGRAFKTLTFWLRPAFALRVVNRFQRIAGFDRAIALASSALTGLVPLTVLIGTILGPATGGDLSNWINERYELTGAGADAVEGAFTPTGDTSASVGLIGGFFLLLAVLSFTRTMQRLFEQTWELGPLSYRNTLNGLRWLVGLVFYAAISAAIHAKIGQSKLDITAAVMIAPISAVFLAWSGWRLSARRIDWGTILPFALIGALALAIYSVGASVYVPIQFNTYASRYGTIGAVLAIISTLFCITVVLVGSAALGREVSDELRRIRSGQRPPDDEIRQEWEKVIAVANERWVLVNEQLARFRRRG
jgi:hypothetical protein